MIKIKCDDVLPSIELWPELKFVVVYKKHKKTLDTKTLGEKWIRMDGWATLSGDQQQTKSSCGER